MRARRLLSGVAALSALAACTASPRAPERVRLAYRFDAGDRSAYELTAHGGARWRLGGRGHGSYDATFEVSERVVSADSTGAIVEVSLRRTSAEEKNLPAPAAQPKSFRLQLGHDGAVRDVLQIDGAASPALQPDELVLIGTYRPPLPPRRVSEGDAWRAEQQVEVGSILRRIVTHGVLRALERRGRSVDAALAYAGESPLVWTTALPEGSAELTGTAETRSTTRLDVDGGFVRSASAFTRGDFDVRVVPRGGRPSMTGTLDLSLRVQLRRLL